MKHLIIGASAAGIAAARKLRELRPHDEITVAARESRVHSRCMLHLFISGKKSADDINFAGTDFFEKYNIKFVPLMKKFDDALKYAPVDFWTADGVHPKAPGHELIKREWIKAFNEIK